MKKKLWTRLCAGALACVLVLPLTGCNGTNATDLTDGYERSSQLEESSQTENSSEQDQTVTTDVEYEFTINFAVQLLQNSMKSNKEKGEQDTNTLISPISIMSALAMTANGAKGETLEQMESVFGVSMEEVNRELGAYILGCDDNDQFKINIANSIWFRDDDSLTVNPEFLQTNVDYYDASIYTAPFDNTTVTDINNWVKKNTDGMIPSILNTIPKDAAMYLVNAVAFDARWMVQYKEYSVRENTFTKEDGTQSTVDFMYSEEWMYLESENATGFMKPYKGGDYAFVALLPNEGMTVEEYVATLDGEGLYQMLQSVQPVSVKTSMPKFKTEYTTELSDILSAMGMVDAFDVRLADFTGIGTSTNGNLFINDVLHKTYICVDENGTKAGAATVVDMNAGAAEQEEPKQVYLNRPFVYMILDTKTDKPLFIGTMMDVEK